MHKKTEESWLNDIRIAIGMEPPQLFRVLNILSDNNNVEGICAREIKSELLKCIKGCKIFLGEIRISANNYTLHDLQHSINVISLMGQLIKNSGQISAIELICLIYSALLHDIGMVKCGYEKNISLDDIRNEHGNRSAVFIQNEMIQDESGQSLNYGRYHLILKKYLPFVCSSHMKDFSCINDLPTNLHVDGMRFNVAMCAILLRLADAMDLFRNRAPVALYNFLNLKGISQEHWKKHLSITDCFIDENGFYRVDGICDDELAHRALYSHFDMIEGELRNAIIWFDENECNIELSIKSNIVKRNISTEGYSIWHHTFSMDFLSISSLFMDERLYGSKEVGLREIIQNSIDACLVRKEYESRKKLIFNHYIPYITINFDDMYIYIRDNGIGMTDEILEKYFLNIGVSYYQSQEYKDENLLYKPLGFFGIGFLACFMLSDEIWIKTSSYKENVELRLHLVKGDKYVTKYTYHQKKFSGTEIKLKKEIFFKVFTKTSFFTEKTDAMYNVKQYINNNFWKLNIINDNETGFELEIKDLNFEEYLINTNKTAQYKILLSKYLNDIEGCIFFEDSKSYKEMWKKSDIKLNSMLEALQKGKIEMNGNLKKSIPFCEKCFLFKENEIHMINHVSQIPDAYIWILIPQYQNQETITELMNYTVYKTESKIQSSLYDNKWYSLFVPKDFGERFNKTISVSYYERSFEIYWHDLSEISFIKKLEKSIGCEINYIMLRKNYGNTVSAFLTTFYMDRTTFIGLNQQYWLKYIGINGPDMDIDWYMFDDFKYNINIKNEEISPQASRYSLTDSSNQYLLEAIQIVKFIWLLEQLKGKVRCEASVSYLRNELVRCWNPNNPLLRSEFKPNY